MLKRHSHQTNVSRMSLTKRTVREIPLNELWIDEALLDVKRTSCLTRIDIKSILKDHPVAFVVADIGQPLRWVKLSECYNFWKSEAEKQIADNPDLIDLNDFPNNYAFIASKWTGRNGEDIILLEKIH